MANMNFDRKENIEYSKSFVAFLDVLGFKNLVFSKKLSDKNKLEEYFGIIEEVLNLTYFKSIQSIIISDSIILSINQETTQEENINILRELCIASGLIQAILATKNIWLRGAVSSGDSYFNADKHQILGPAYINAYLLEEEQAIYPRIILDTRLVNELSYTNSAELIKEINLINTSNWASSILFDWENSKNTHFNYFKKDIPLFIDYLILFTEKEKKLVSKIINHVETNIHLNHSIYKKFKWVSEYLETLLYDDKNLLKKLKNF